MEKYMITYDVGTTSLKTCLFCIGDKISLVESESQGYGLTITKNGGAEQNPEDWWDAMRNTTIKVVGQSRIHPDEICGLSFCAQMQGVVLVDKEGNPVRNAMSYMDNRATGQMADTLETGIQIDGVNLFKLLKSIRITGVAASSAKDPVWKYKWVRDNEPEAFQSVYKWLDVKEFLILKTCGKFIMTEDSAYSTMLLDIRGNKRKFSKRMCRMLGVDFAHLPDVVRSTDVVGKVTKRAAKALGLSEGTLVFGGGGDASLIGIGAGAAKPGDTHVYMGTSGWVSTVIDKPELDISCKIAGIVGANQKTYNYFAELETAGKCIEWVKEHLAYEETIERMQASNIDGDYEDIAVDLYDYMMQSIRDVPAGSSGVIFAPWLHGNRCPFEDTRARGMFFNIGIGTKKAELIHSVIEGVCYHLRWQLECCGRKITLGKKIRFVGGGALAPTTCQILSDILGMQVEVIHNPQNAGAMGAAIIVAAGMGIIGSLEEANQLIDIDRVYYPDRSNSEVYAKCFGVFKNLYYNNRKSFGTLNSQDNRFTADINNIK